MNLYNDYSKKQNKSKKETKTNKQGGALSVAAVVE